MHFGLPGTGYGVLLGGDEMNSFEKFLADHDITFDSEADKVFAQEFYIAGLRWSAEIVVLMQDGPNMFSNRIELEADGIDGVPVKED